MARVHPAGQSGPREELPGSAGEGFWFGISGTGVHAAHGPNLSVLALCHVVTFTSEQSSILAYQGLREERDYIVAEAPTAIPLFQLRPNLQMR